MADHLQQRDAEPIRFKPTPLQRRVAAMIKFSPYDGRKNVAERLLDVLVKVVLPVLETIDKSEMPGGGSDEGCPEASSPHPRRACCCDRTSTPPPSRLLEAGPN